MCDEKFEVIRWQIDLQLRRTLALDIVYKAYSSKVKGYIEICINSLYFIILAWIYPIFTGILI